MIENAYTKSKLYKVEKIYEYLKTKNQDLISWSNHNVQKTNVLVTGGTGLVGRELVELLVNEGANVTSISMDDNNLNSSWNVKYLKKDLRDINNCFEVCEGQDYIYHIAGIKGSQLLLKLSSIHFSQAYFR